jgi:diguanylate cyclase (GGDEF)-like protein
VLHAADLEALLALVRSHDTADAQVQAARLRTLLGQTAECLEPHIRALIERTAELQRTKELAMTDALTGVANRRALNDALRRELARAERSGESVAVLLFDIDAFKAINDMLGHAAGDRALRLVARCLQHVTRQGDLVTRIGGDEFAVLLPDIDIPGARAIGERTRRALAHAGESGPRVQVSFGLALAAPGSLSGTALLAAADADLYRDKAARKTLRSTAARLR